MTAVIKSLYSSVCKIVLILQVIQGTVNVVCGGLATSHTERPGKNLCIQRKENVSCSNQVTSGSNFQNASCWVNYLSSNSSDCSDSAFDGKRGPADKFGIVNLSPFLWRDDAPFLYSNLNLTFTQINWKRLKFRFVKLRKRERGTAFCRELVVSEYVDPSSVISYDCLWNQNLQEEELQFQYLLTTTDGLEYRYTNLLRIPNDHNIKTGNYIFMILDISEFPKIFVKLQAPQVKLNITHINITLYYKENLNSVAEVIDWKMVIDNIQEGHFISYEPYKVDSPGYYYFNASFYCDSCDDRFVESSTPFIERKGYDPLVVAAVVILMMFMCFTAITITLKRRCKKFPNEQYPPNILFVYESCYPSHINNIYRFKDFLEDYYDLKPKMDLVDISNTANGCSKDIWSWYSNEVKMADYVFLFASPHENTKKGIHEDNIYHDFDVFNKTILILVNSLNQYRFKIVGIKLPGCSRFHTQIKCAISKEFTLPNKLPSLTSFLNIGSLKNGASKFTYVYEQRSRRERCKLLAMTPSVASSFPQPYDLESDSELREALSDINLDGEPSYDDESEEYEVYDSSLISSELKL